jgi:hypothetical protein
MCTLLNCLHNQGVRTSETSVYFNEITRRYIPKLSCSYSALPEPEIASLYLYRRAVAATSTAHVPDKVV